jgi:glycosyltransferase involved in cell wall biosynthesis
VAEALDAFAPDLVHVVNPAVLGLGGIWLAKTKGIPLVASYHTHLPKYLEHYGMGMLEPLLWELLKAAHNQAQLNLLHLHGHGGGAERPRHPTHRPLAAGR